MIPKGLMMMVLHGCLLCRSRIVSRKRGELPAYLYWGSNVKEICSASYNNHQSVLMSNTATM